MSRGILLLALAAALPAMAAKKAPPDPNNRPIQVIETWSPYFPNAGEFLGITHAAVTVIVAVDETGRLTDAVATDATAEEFAQVALAAVRHWQYRPARVKGQAVAAVRAVNFTFDAEGAVLVTQSVSENIEAHLRELTASAHQYRAYLIREVDRPPVPVANPVPAYPAELRTAGIKGPVECAYYIDEQGRVRAPAVINHAPPELARLTLDAVRQWRFTPARRHGRPVLLQVAQTIQFGHP